MVRRRMVHGGEAAICNAVSVGLRWQGRFSQGGGAGTQTEQPGLGQEVKLMPLLCTTALSETPLLKEEISHLESAKSIRTVAVRRDGIQRFMAELREAAVCTYSLKYTKKKNIPHY